MLQNNKLRVKVPGRRDAVQISRLLVDVDKDHGYKTSFPMMWSLIRVERCLRDVKSCIKVSSLKTCMGGEGMSVPRSPDLWKGNGSLCM